MEAKNIFYGVLSTIMIIMAMNFFFVDLTASNNLAGEGLDMSKFNKTAEILSNIKEMKNETGFLADVPLIGDVVAIVGNAVRALQVIFSIPGTIMSMVTEAFSLGGIPAWVELIISAFVWVAIIWIFIYVAVGRGK